MTDRKRATSFGTEAGAYDRARPEYPAEAVRWFLGGAGTSAPLTVADAGAGTGKLTGVLQAAGHDVVAIDPDPQMLDALTRRYPGIPTLVGTGEQLPLADASVDAVTFGQAWHWVDPVLASPEVARVLRPGGVLGLFWNLRDESVEWVRELSGIMHPSTAETMIAEGGVVVTAPFGPAEEFSVEWQVPFDADGLVDLAASRSYVIAETPQRRAAILDGVRALAERVAGPDGRVAMPYRTRVYRYRIT